ncbi:aspartic protease PEP1 [Corynespora cassiicola Philippines]|uniref:Aspartic protease PEP1 n=1 Tax=Corynespora cassiicola Philippines TaxID=1448308 RepID=A0A2T2PBG2_CORCC|nr:aspartic protease PEP1 [Corynespora cassiicola Philippines]
MPSYTLLTAAVALAGAAVASPVDIRKRETFSISQVARKTYLKNGPEQVAKTLRKFGKPVPDHILAAATNRAAAADLATISSDDNSSVPAVPGDEYDTLYLSPVTIGNTTVHLDFDTGSGDLWVFSSLQKTSELSGHDYYKVDPSKEVKGASWNISYADGSGASGKVYADKVVVGGVTAASQAVEAASRVSAQFTKDKDTDGLLGLSFSVLNTIKPKQQTTFFDTVKDQLPEPLFAVDLKYHAAGSYDFGFIDDSKYTGEITYVDAESDQGWWGFTADGYTVGDGSDVAASISGIADTGTSLMYLPSKVIKEYYAGVQGAKIDASQGGWVFPCSAELPDFSLSVGGVKQTVPGKHINYATSEGDECFGGIQPNDGFETMSIFGDVFLKSKYVIHEAKDGSAPRIGFGQQPGV